jgi:CheY-like chemotaxis protein
MVNDKRYKILIIDDDKFLLDVYSVKFREFGHDILTAFGGEEALEKIKKGDNFDAVVLDIVMPEMDGFEFLASLRKDNLAKNSVIIVLTNQGETKDIEKAREFDIDGYIIKASTIPSDVLKEVLSIVEKHK